MDTMRIPAGTCRAHNWETLISAITTHSGPDREVSIVMELEAGPRWPGELPSITPTACSLPAANGSPWCGGLDRSVPRQGPGLAGHCPCMTAVPSRACPWLEVVAHACSGADSRLRLAGNMARGRARWRQRPAGPTQQWGLRGLQGGCQVLNQSC